jgi:capsular exopolysaccharide synthesis family protein
MSRMFEALHPSQRETAEPFISPVPLPGTIPVPGFQTIATECVHIPPECRVVVHTEPWSFGADRFRLLRTRLRERFRGAQRRIVLVTSPLPGDGKSTVALNLATALAEHGKHTVLLLEGDLYNPSLLRRLGLRSWAGLAENLQGECAPLAALRRIEPLGCYVLPAGGPVSNPTELLHSERFSPLVKGLSAHFEWILMDSPPTNPVADVLALKAQADGCLLVVRAARTPREALEESVRQLGSENVLGVVLNGAEGLDRRYSAYYGKYYTGGQDRSGQKR